MPARLQKGRTHGLRRGLAVAVALSGCTTEPSTPFKPATYILQSIGELALPATYTSITYADHQEHIRFVYDTVTIVSDTHFVRSFRVIHLSLQATSVDTIGGQRVNYPGTILHRDGAVLLDPQSGLGISIETVELQPVGPNLRRRMVNSELFCGVGQLPPLRCETLRDELVDALYVRR